MLFLRFADGCRHALEDKGEITKKDSREIQRYLHGTGPKPSGKTLERVYYVAFPGLQKVAKRLRKDYMYDVEVVREFYSRDHNKRMFDKGNLICIAYPARVVDVEPIKTGSGRKPSRHLPVCKTLVELEPVTGIFKLESDINLRKGDWVIVHRMNVIERIDKAFADSAMTYLRNLGLDKKRVFPEKSYKYLTELRYSSVERHTTGEFAEIVPRGERQPVKRRRRPARSRKKYRK